MQKVHILFRKISNFESFFFLRYIKSLKIKKISRPLFSSLARAPLHILGPVPILKYSLQNIFKVYKYSHTTQSNIVSKNHVVLDYYVCVYFIRCFLMSPKIQTLNDKGKKKHFHSRAATTPQCLNQGRKMQLLYFQIFYFRTRIITGKKLLTIIGRNMLLQLQIYFQFFFREHCHLVKMGGQPLQKGNFRVERW